MIFMFIFQVRTQPFLIDSLWNRKRFVNRLRRSEISIRRIYLLAPLKLLKDKLLHDGVSMPNILLLLVNRMMQNSVFKFSVKMMNFVILSAITYLDLYHF